MCASIVFKILLSVKSAMDEYQQGSQEKPWTIPYGVVCLPLLIAEFFSVLCCAQLSCWFDEGGDQEQRQRSSDNDDDDE
jgi:hypothetical protein